MYKPLFLIKFRSAKLQIQTKPFRQSPWQEWAKLTAVEVDTVNPPALRRNGSLDITPKPISPHQAKLCSFDSRGGHILREGGMFWSSS